MKKDVDAWEGKRKYYKVGLDGSPILDAYNFFNYRTYKSMTDSERDRWMAEKDIDAAPIPAEVIDFKNKLKENAELKQRIAELEGLLKKEEAEEVMEDFKYADAEMNDKIDIDDDLAKPSDVTTDTFELPEEEKKDKVKAQLDDLGIRYSHNSKLSTLEKKLQDATNPE